MQEKKDKKYWREARRARRRVKRAEKRRERREALQRFSFRIRKYFKEKKRIRKEKAKQAQLEHERKKRQEKEAGGFWAVRRRRLRRFFLRVWRKLKSLKNADRKHIVALAASRGVGAWTLSVSRSRTGVWDDGSAALYGLPGFLFPLETRRWTFAGSKWRKLDETKAEVK